MRRASLAFAIYAVLLLTTDPALPGPGAPDPARTAREQYARGDTAAAIANLERIDLEDADDPALFMLLGRLYRDRGTIRDRLKSQELLERAAQLYPEHPGVFVELGNTYFSRTFYPDAVRGYKHALEYNPGLCEAKYKLGVSYYEHWKLRVNAYWDDCADGRAWLKSSLRCDSTNVDAAVRYVNAAYALDMTDEAAAACTTFATRFPRTPEFHLLLGTIA
jgi:tetratricopeptide (TPR) repeat protein